MEVVWVVPDVNDDLLRLDDPLVRVPAGAVVVPHGHVEPPDLDILHAVGGRDDEAVGDCGAPAEMDISWKKGRVIL